MGINVQKYPLKHPLTTIQRHEQLPEGTVVLGACVDKSIPLYDSTYTLLKHEGYLSVVRSWISGKVPSYKITQKDFPLRTLSWLPWALETYRKPPSAGGLHAGAMISKDMDVDGEILTIGSMVNGYVLTNWTRNQHHPLSDFDPATVYLSYELLYDYGLLDMWTKLGQKYGRGEI